jgi:hypothetical protein
MLGSGTWGISAVSGRASIFQRASSGQGKYFDCPIELNGVETPSKGWVDDVSTDYAIEFIRKNKAQPWSLVVGYKTAHGPFTPPERAKDRFAGAEARPVPNLDVPAIYLADSAAAKPKKAAGTAAKRPTNLGYFRCLSAADDNLGQVARHARRTRSRREHRRRLRERQRLLPR